MKYINSYKLFESKKETEDIVKDVFSKLPKDFYYRMKSDKSRGVNDRNISSAINEYGSIRFTIVKLGEEDGKTWSVDKREVKTNSYKRFMFRDVKGVIEELIKRLPNYRLVDDKYRGYVSNGSSLIGNESWDKFNSSSYIKLQLDLRLNNLPSFRGVKTDNDNEIKDIFISVFDTWGPEINIKEAGDYYKIMSIQSNISPYQITPLDKDGREELVESILRFESAMDCDLISTSLEYRNYERVTHSDRDFSINTKGFNSPNLEKNKELAFEFIKSHEITEFTIIFKKI